MKIKNLNIKAFGHFTDYVLNFDDGFNIVYGNNEAGKTTSLRAITDVLFGIPNNTKDNFLHPGNKLRIEAKLDNSENKEFTFLRKKGLKNTLLDSEENVVENKTLNNYTGGISRDYFTTMFGLNHTRLRKGSENLLQMNGEVGGSIFEASSGISNIKEISEGLNKKADNLYKKGARIPEINMLVSQFKQLKKDKKDNMFSSSNWKELKDTYEDKSDKLKINKDDLIADEIKHKKLERIIRLIPFINDLNREKFKLKDYNSEFYVNSDDILKLENLFIKKEKFDEELLKIDSRLNNLEEKNKFLIIPENILENELIIEELYKKNELYNENFNKKPVLLEEKDQIEKDIKKIFRNIDKDLEKIDDIEKYRINEFEKENLRELIKKKKSLEDEKEMVIKRSNLLKDEVSQLENRIEILSDFRENENLEILLKEISNESNLEKELNEMQKNILDLKININVILNKININNEKYEDILNFSIPLEATIKEFINKFEEKELNVKQIKTEILELEDGRITLNSDLKKLEASGVLYSLEDLINIRKKRNATWNSIKNSLQDKSNNQDLLLNEKLINITLDEDIARADEVSDNIIDNIKIISEKRIITINLEALEEKLNNRKNKLAIFLEEKATIEKEWTKIWINIPTEILNPKEMLDWFNDYNKIIENIKDLFKLNKSKEDIDKKNIKIKDKLKNEIIEIDSNKKLDNLNLKELINLSEKLNEDIKNKKIKIENYNEELINKKTSIRAFERNLEGFEKNENKINKDLKESISILNMTDSLKIFEIEFLINKLDDAFNLYESYKKLNKSIDEKDKYIKDYEEKSEKLFISLKEENKDINLGLYSLHKKLEKSKSDDNLLKNNLKELEKEILEKQKIKIELDIIKNRLIEFNTNYKTKDDIKLFELIQRSKQFNLLNIEIDNIEKSIIKSSDGLSLEEVYIEQKDIDLNTVEAEKIRLIDKISIIKLKISEMEREFGVIENEYNTKIKGTSLKYANITENQEEILAKMKNKVEKFIEYKFAEILLSKSIEYFRTKNQNPIIKEASAIFAEITLNSFDRIKISFDDKTDDPIIVGIKKGEEVLISQMSDGTIDQLFLSLRLASIKKYTTNKEALPIILDDILINFDDERTEKILEMLLKLSEDVQIIYFTHHKKIIEISKKLLKNINIQSIDTKNK